MWRLTLSSILLLAPAAVSAQSTSTSRGYQSTYTTRPTLVLFANGGGNSSLTDLNDAGTASLGTSWTAGGGLGVQLNRYTAVRGTFDFARTEGKGVASGTLDVDVSGLPSDVAAFVQSAAGGTADDALRIVVSSLLAQLVEEGRLAPTPAIIAALDEHPAILDRANTTLLVVATPASACGERTLSPPVVE